MEDEKKDNITQLRPNAKLETETQQTQQTQQEVAAQVAPSPAPPPPRPITCPHCRAPLSMGTLPVETLFPNGQKAQSMVYSCVGCGSVISVSHIGIVQPQVISEDMLRRGPSNFRGRN